VVGRVVYPKRMAQANPRSFRQSQRFTDKSSGGRLMLIVRAQTEVNLA
jgi:hypothetical protein